MGDWLKNNDDNLGRILGEGKEEKYIEEQLHLLIVMFYLCDYKIEFIEKLKVIITHRMILS